MFQIRLLALFARCLHLFLVSVPASWSLLGAGEAPLQVGSTKQLFLGPWTEDGRDGHLAESMTGVTIRMNEARATGERLMVQNRPWEGTGMLDMRQFVLRDGGPIPHLLLGPPLSRPAGAGTGRCEPAAPVLDPGAPAHPLLRRVVGRDPLGKAPIWVWFHGRAPGRTTSSFPTTNSPTSSRRWRAPGSSSTPTLPTPKRSTRCSSRSLPFATIPRDRKRKIRRRTPEC